MLAAALFALGVAVAVLALTREAGTETAVVPTVVGLTRTTAEARIRAAGFVAHARRADGPRAEVVVGQRPEPGATLPRGSLVTISVARAAR